MPSGPIAADHPVSTNKNISFTASRCIKVRNYWGCEIHGSTLPHYQQSTTSRPIWAARRTPSPAARPIWAACRTPSPAASPIWAACRTPSPAASPIRAACQTPSPAARPIWALRTQSLNVQFPLGYRLVQHCRLLPDRSTIYADGPPTS